MDPDPVALDWPPRRRPAYSDACRNDELTTEARTPSRSLTRTLRKLPHATKPCGGLDSSRVPRVANRDQVDPAALPGPGAVQRSFWGVTHGGHRPLGRGKGAVGATPYYCLVPPGAEVQARTFPAPKRSAKGQAHLGATPREDERNSSAQKEPTLTYEAILRLCGARR